MDVNQHPDFVPTYADIERRFGHVWAKRFVLTAPLILDDPTSPLRRAFVQGLSAHAAGDRRAELRWWTTCEKLLDELAGAVVADAEAILQHAA
ncbi:hypothetical protein [Cellulomonas endophytica]|uniref:hypothetical protein n=1 Tax=Cellulomonas endophytica TaxID=2494735 RepID=UPI0010109052|nr:hypothetical protein [Cellulomonas endophytica]